MPNYENLHSDWFFFFALLVALSILAPALYAQQAEIPPASTEGPAAGGPANAQATGTDRIVDGKPPLYAVKRVAHPVSWFDKILFRPVLRLVEKAGFDKAAANSEQKSPPVSGIKFGIKGLGAGSGFGPEIKPFHNNLFNRGVEFEAPFLLTYRLYEQGRARINFPILSGESNRLGFELTGRYTSRASDNFFGIGNESSSGDGSRFRSVTRTAGAALEARVRNVWSVRAEAGYRSVGITRPKGFVRSYESSMDAFRDEDIPGLTTDPGAGIAYARGVLQRDSRNSPRLADAGGLQRIEVTLNEGQRGGDFAYWHYRADIQQFLPLSQDHRKVLAFRGSIETNQEKGGSTIPFFDLPSLGSQSTLRGFENRRFTDKSAMSASLEYRYRIWRYLDLGVFGDAGQVAPEIRNFALERLHTGYGARFVLRTQGHRGVIFDVAHSRERPWMLYVDFSPLF